MGHDMYKPSTIRSMLHNVPAVNRHLWEMKKRPLMWYSLMVKFPLEPRGPLLLIAT